MQLEEEAKMGMPFGFAGAGGTGYFAKTESSPSSSASQTQRSSRVNTIFELMNASKSDTS